MSHWAQCYIGKPWVSGARGPEAFDCWGLLRWIYSVHYGVELPLFPGVDATNPLAVGHAMSAELGRPCSPWERIERPIEGCGVAMGAGKRFHHVGVWLEADGGLVLHAARKRNVTAQGLSSLRNSGISNIAYFKHHGTHSRSL